MDCNDLNRRIRFALSLDDAAVVDLFRLAKYKVDLSAISAWRLTEKDEGYKPCPPRALHAMLDGLIVERRGPREDADASPDKVPADNAEKQSPDATIVNNNDVLKQLRIALSLKADDVLAMIIQGGGKLGKGEVGALFRNPSARNYRQCGDQVLRWFLAGLAKQRTDGSE